MRAIRELPVAAPVVLAGLALFFGGGPADEAIWWLGLLALASVLVLLATHGAPRGAVGVVPLAALGVWCAISISWSGLPDRSWDYANRTVVYALAAAIGAFAAGRTGALARGLAAVLGVLVVWSLLGKVLPFLYDYGSQDVTRLRGPIGLWNQLALATDFALVLALALRRRAGTLLAYAALVALLLTYSRGGLLTAVVVAVAWLALDRERIEGGVTLAAAAVPAAVVVGIAFLLPGVTSDAQPLHVRWRDGLVFGALLVAGAVAAVALERLPRPRDSRGLRRGAAAVAGIALAAAVAYVVVNGIGNGAVGNGGGRYGSLSSNFRTTWWEQAWHGFRERPLLGHGAGTFHLLNLRFRDSFLDFTIEPHDLPLQVMAELGLVGLALLVAACVLLVRPVVERRGVDLALGLFLPAFLVHSLLDVDWDFAAVSIPAFVAAGAVAARPAADRRVSPVTLLPAVGVALLLAGSFVSPWLARRYADQALAAAPARAAHLADRAHALDPFLVEPYLVRADAALQRGRKQRAFDEYVAAVHRQPKNPQTWVYAGEYAWTMNCPGLAYTYLERYTELDPQARPSAGGDDYRAARARVNARDYTC
jgi:O-Antigen ligase